MAKQTINIGASPNDGTGTPLRTAFDYTNQNFTELYTALGGGVGLPGAITQVLFNNGTNVAGDAGLVYNSTTDALTIGGNVQAGSATISGDLTVDTSTLKVDSANNRVGVLTANPTHTLDVRGIIKSNGTYTAYVNPSFIGAAAIQTESAESLILAPSGQESLRCAPSGVYTFGDGVGGTRMTLNATGLGVGGSPTQPLTVRSSVAAIGMFHSTNANGPYLIFQNSTANFGDIGSELAITGGGSAGNLTLNSRFTSNLCFAVYDSVKMRIDSSGNVGIGVTPSAWNTNYKALELASNSGSWSAATGINDFSLNAYLNASSQWIYKTTATAVLYRQQTGQHLWYNALSGTAGNAILFTQAMTLDASGNLLVGTTSLAGSSSNTAALILGSARTANGSVSALVSTATTIFSITAALRGRYEVVAMVAGSGSVGALSAIATVIWDGSAGRVVANNGTNLTITLSGSDVQITQSSGSTQTVFWSFLRISLA